MYKISIPQKNLILSCDDKTVKNKNLMDFLIESGLPVASSCHGEGICSKCAVEVTPAPQLTDLQSKTLSQNKLDLKKRLCCQIFIEEDISVTTTYW